MARKKARTQVITLSVQEMAERIQQYCNVAFEHMNRADAAHGGVDDETSRDGLHDALEAMGDELWEARKFVAEIRLMAASIERWAADPTTD